MTLNASLLDKLRREDKNVYDALMALQGEIDVLRSNLIPGESFKDLREFDLGKDNSQQATPWLKVVPGIACHTLRFPDETEMKSAETQSCRVTHSVAQATTSGVQLFLAFDTERYDNYAMHDVTVNNSRITIPREGTYLVGCSIRFAADDVGQRDVVIRKNGATVIARHNTPDVGATVVAIHITVNCVDYFLKDDYLEVGVTQNSGVAMNINVVAQESPEFWAHALGLR